MSAHDFIPYPAFGRDHTHAVCANNDHRYCDGQAYCITPECDDYNAPTDPESAAWAIQQVDHAVRELIEPVEGFARDVLEQFAALPPWFVLLGIAIGSSSVVGLAVFLT